MKKITSQAIKAFWYGRDFKLNNTEVKNFADNTSLLLHGNRIAMFSKLDNTLKLSSCGWESVTTKERLNGILSDLGYYIKQSKFVWYIVNRKTNIIEPFYDGYIIDCSNL